MKVVYLSMEFAIDQALKTYSGGLGFLAGSYARSMHEMKKEGIGISLLWSYGYYDQAFDQEGYMVPTYVRKRHHFLEDANINFTVNIHGHDVQVKTMVLKPEVFGSFPIYLLTTDIEENDHLSRTITHHLYDPHQQTRIAQSILLGIGGYEVCKALNYQPTIYHLNEAEPLPLVYKLIEEQGKINTKDCKVVFTTHTPEKAGNSTNPLLLLIQMGFFGDLSIDAIRKHSIIENGMLNYTATALQLSHKTNAVSELHAKVSKDMWKGIKNGNKIIGITNGQNVNYWQDEELIKAVSKKDSKKFKSRKTILKEALFKEVANQTGKLFDPEVLTIVWSRRFAGYKRAWLLFKDIERFIKLTEQTKYPVQIIWAGKPYPLDNEGVNLFKHIQGTVMDLPNCAALIGYELALSKLLKQGSDIWLNNPRYGHEASGTSGMAASMNGSLNLSTNDGWIPEFIKDKKNAFLIKTSTSPNQQEMDNEDYNSLMDAIEKKVLPTYYKSPDKWFEMICTSMPQVMEGFSSHRMVQDYYDKLYK